MLTKGKHTEQTYHVKLMIDQEVQAQTDAKRLMVWLHYDNDIHVFIAEKCVHEARRAFFALDSIFVDG